MASVHLSFDNGPHPEGTPAVLDTLRRRGLDATFFVLGKHLATPTGADLARRVRDAGHRLGHHSYSHEIPLGEDPRPEAIEDELGRTHTLLRAIWQGPRWFRPFGGGGRLGPHLLSPAAVDWLGRHAYTCALWNVVPGDWLDPDGWVERALAGVDAQRDAVVVLHDILPDAMANLEYFLMALREEGHSFTTELPPDCTPMIRGRCGPELVSFTQSWFEP